MFHEKTSLVYNFCQMGNKYTAGWFNMRDVTSHIVNAHLDNAQMKYHAVLFGAF